MKVNELELLENFMERVHLWWKGAIKLIRSSMRFTWTSYKLIYSYFLFNISINKFYFSNNIGPIWVTVPAPNVKMISFGFTLDFKNETTSLKSGI